MNRIDENDPRAKSVQIAADIQNQILSGQIGAGSQLPSEHELAALYGAPRTTVQLAVRKLADEGLIIRGGEQRKPAVVVGAPALSKYKRALRADLLVALDSLRQKLHTLTAPSP